MMRIATKNAEYEFIPELGIFINAELNNEFSHLLPKKLDEKKIIAGINREISDDFIETHLKSARNITFCVTHDCNFRCGYCIYSGDYNNVRTHSKKKMSLRTAQKVIDLLVELVTSDKRSTKSTFINISFYGGEPLLEVPLIRDIMEYTKRLFIQRKINDKFRTRYRITTNGFLLKKKVVDFLVDRDILIDVSLDGPQGEHDKYRFTRNGDKTWGTVMSNLRDINKRYPDYYANRVKYQSTLHPLHDYSSIEKFFICDETLFGIEKVKTNFVNMYMLDNNIKDEIVKKQVKQSSFLAMRAIVDRLDEKLTFKKINYNTYFTQMCFPGKTKIFVDVDGKLHTCERVKLDLPIGDVDNGFNYDNIRYILRLWHDIIIRYRCWDCPAWSFCNVCLAQFYNEKGNENCTYKKNVKKTLTDYIKYKEEEQLKRIPVKAETPRDFMNLL